MTLLKVNNKFNGNSIDTLFDELFNTFPASRYSSSGNGLNFPPVNIYENNDGYQLHLNAPGRNKEDFSIVVDKGLLTISYEKKEGNNTESKIVRNEFSLPTFKRSFSIEENIDHENIQAKYENGVLIVTLVKKEQPKETTRQINIQ